MKKALFVAAIVSVVVFGLVASAYAATGNVVIAATVNSKLILTVPADHDFGAFAPDAANPAAWPTDVNVRSNISYTIGRSEASTAPAGVFTVNDPSGMDGSTPQPKSPSAAGTDYAQDFALDLRPAGDWLDPDTYSKTYTYTATPL